LGLSVGVWGYVHYRKASVVLYYLKEMIGEEKVNATLRKLIRQYAHNAPPLPGFLGIGKCAQRTGAPTISVFDQGFV
jgi:hypothetical protein